MLLGVQQPSRWKPTCPLILMQGFGGKKVIQGRLNLGIFTNTFTTTRKHWLIEWGVQGKSQPLVSLVGGSLLLKRTTRQYDVTNFYKTEGCCQSIARWEGFKKMATKVKSSSDIIRWKSQLPCGSPFWGLKPGVHLGIVEVLTYTWQRAVAEKLAAAS